MPGCSPGFTLSLVFLEALNEVFLLLSHRFSLHFIEFVSEAQTALSEFFRSDFRIRSPRRKEDKKQHDSLASDFVLQQSLLAESYSTMKVDKISLFLWSVYLASL